MADGNEFTSPTGHEHTTLSSAQPFSIQRMLHFDESGNGQQATPQRFTPSKRVASGGARTLAQQSAARHVPEGLVADVSTATSGLEEEITPRRSTRLRTELDSPAPHQAQRTVPTPAVPRRSPRQSSPARSRPQVKQGRPQGEMWEHYAMVKVGGKKTAVCNYCSTSLNNPKPSFNMSTHLLRGCKNVSVTVKEKIMAATCAPTQQAQQTQSTTYSDVSKNRSASLVPPIDQAAFNLLLVQLIVVCALPFSILDSVAFKDFVKKLAPGIKVPPRQFLTKELLQTAATAMRQDVIARIKKQKFVSIVTDGWSDPNGSKIVNFMVVAPEMPSLFWSSWASGSEAHTSDNLEQKTKTVIEEIEELTSARVVGIVTDNASNMRGLWGRLRRFAIVAGGCAAHVLNLLMKNLFAHEVLKKVHVNCVQISRFVRDHTGLLETFRAQLAEVRAGGEKRSGLTLPVPTRWYSVFNCLENVLASRDELYVLFTSSIYATLRQRYAQTAAAREKLQYVTAIVEDDIFWQNLRVVVRLIKPIKTAMGKLEKDNGFVSGVYTCFKDLLDHEAYRERAPGNVNVTHDTSTTSGDDDYELPDPSYAAGYQPSQPIVPGVLERFFRQHIRQRWSYVHTNAMGIAFFLDPRCKFTDFAAADEGRTRTAIVNFALDQGIIQPNQRAKLNQEIFDFAEDKEEAEGMEMTSPRGYWKSMARSYPFLGQIAQTVFALPTSSAASERAWSIFNHIHTKKRNRLSVEKVELLVYIYINYAALNNEEKIDMARHVSQPECVDAA